MSPWRLMLTRPAEECAALAHTLGEAGIASSCMPLLAIEPVMLQRPQLELLKELSTYQGFIVVSKPAARLLLAAAEQRQLSLPPQGWFTVGAATAAVLQDAQLDVSFPACGDDSEALLELPALQQVLANPAPRILIVRGVGGRELLAERLAQLGATVE